MRNVLLLLCIVLNAAAVTANPIQLSFSLEPAHTLPGIPVTFRVTATNTASTVVSLPHAVRLEVLTDQGASSIFSGSRGEEDFVFFPAAHVGESFDLRPGEQRKLDFFAGPSSPPWFCDERLQRPGTYRLRLRVDREVVNGRRVPSVDPIVSNEVVLTIAAPTGVDAEAWKLIGNGNVCLGWDVHAATLWSQYPDSVYTSMTVRPSPNRDREAELESFKATLAKNPPAGFADSLKQAIANRHLMFMGRAVYDGDLATAYEHSEAARVILHELATKDTDVILKAAARQALDLEVKTQDQLKQWEAEIRLIVPPKKRCEAAQVAAVRAEIAQVIAAPDTTSKTRAKLEMVVKHLDRYAAEVATTPPSMSRAMHELRMAVGEIDGAGRSLITQELSVRWLGGLIDSAAIAARKAVQAAAADSAARAHTVAQAQETLGDAEAAAARREWREAARLYKAALDKAELASAARGDFC